MATLTIHHWPDKAAGLREMRRVTRGPIVLLTFDNLELSNLYLHEDFQHFECVYMWQGDFRLLIAIIKQLEDRLNVDHDTRIAVVQTIIAIEDNVRYYSHLLPMIYREVILQAQRLIAEGINLSHKEIRTRARPKVLHCINFEEAWDFFEMRMLVHLRV